MAKRVCIETNVSNFFVEFFFVLRNPPKVKLYFLHAISSHCFVRTTKPGKAVFRMLKKLLSTLAPSAGSNGARKKPRILVLGSGWGSFNFLHAIDKKKFHVTCVSPTNHFLFTPLLPSSALGTVEFRSIQEPIRAIKGMAGHYLQGKAVSVDFEKQRVQCQEIFHQREFDVGYDLLLISTGTKSNTFNTPNVLKNEGRTVFFLKNLWHARLIRNRILECFERAAIPDVSPEERKRLLSFIVVGGGPTNVEFVGELSDFLKEDVARFYPELERDITVTIIEAADCLLGTFDKALKSYVGERLKRSGFVDVKLKTSVTALSEDGKYATLSDGSVMPVGMMVWSAGLSPIKFVEGLSQLDRVGGAKRIVVDDQLFVPAKVCGGNVVSLGDCAVNKAEPLAPLAQVARAQAIYLAKALNKLDADELLHRPTKDVFTEKVKPFSYFHMGSMATLGGWRGVIDATHVGGPDHPYNLGRFSGIMSFVIWRSAYLGKQVSASNKMMIPIYWLKTFLFGRDISRF